MSKTTITTFTADDLVRHVPELGALLRACVHDGASVGFVMPCGVDESESFWRGNVLSSLRAGGLVLLVARQGETIAGTVQLAYDTMPNQRHRAEVRKLLVHPGLPPPGHRAVADDGTRTPCAWIAAQPPHARHPHWRPRGAALYRTGLSDSRRDPRLRSWHA